MIHDQIALPNAIRRAVYIYIYIYSFKAVIRM